MPSVIDQVGNIISSIIGVIIGIFQNIFNAIGVVIRTLLSTVFAAISGLAQTFQGLLKFLLGNLLVIGVFIGAVFLYGVYQQRTQSGGRVGTSTMGQKKVA